MKTIFLVIAFFSLYITHAQIQSLRTDEVPTKILQALHSKYPTAEKEIWEKLNESTYEVNCFIGTVQQEVVFDSAGAWWETESMMAVPQMPAPAQKVIHRYKGYKIDMLQKNEKADGSIYYDVILIKGNKRRDFFFTAKGDVLSKMKWKGKT